MVINVHEEEQRNHECRSDKKRHHDEKIPGDGNKEF